MLECDEAIVASGESRSWAGWLYMTSLSCNGMAFDFA